ncbi:MAG: hypothetical protein K5790_10465 [Nitrosopumilus sp.]|uniref:hypothetical protein n=1 Tax=Nitrosopumilus sp. TaxID=2024843 RepID=UPI00247C427E|nr:hypothetical protein [Nitrosopumilus sp.]MCV0393693.1 hypothetical protein [Nitrosopumilus sp.]
MNNQTYIKSFHFEIEGAWLMEMSRTRYWMEDDKEGGFKLLKESLTGISDEQVQSILDGNSILTGWGICDDPKCEQCIGKECVKQVFEEDAKWKLEILKRKLWLNENYYEVGGFIVNKDLVANYIEQYQELHHMYHKNSDDTMEQEHYVSVIKKSFWTTNAHRYPSPEYMPKEGSYDYRYSVAIASFLKVLECYLQSDESFGLEVEEVEERFMKQYSVIKEPLVQEFTPKKVRAETHVLFTVPDPKNNYKKKTFSVEKAMMIHFLDARSRGEQAMKFTQNLNLEKDKVLKRYQKLDENIRYAHKQFMEALSLGHSSTGHYPDNVIECYVNTILQRWMYSNMHEDFSVEKPSSFPNEIELKLPSNKGYGRIFYDGKLVEDFVDFR